MTLELQDQIEKYREFFEISEHYNQQLLEQVRKGNPWVDVEFADLARHSPELADLILEQPEETLKAGQMAIDRMDLPHSSDKDRIKIELRLFHLYPCLS